MPLYNPSSASAVLRTTTQTNTYTATINDDAIFVTSASAWTLTLYPASGNSGKTLIIKKTSNDVNAITVDGDGSETIDGQTTTTINTQYECLKLICDGSNWHILERKFDESWQSYTPTFTGFGTVTGINFISRRAGDSLEVRGTFTTGTTSATEARISLGYGGVDSNVTSKSTLPTLQLVGAMKQGAALSSTDFQDRQVFVEASKGYVVFGASYSTYSSGLLKGNGNGVAASTTTQSLHFSVPIAGWKGN